MGLFKISASAFALATAAVVWPAMADEQVRYGPPPAWVDVAPLLEAPASDQPYVTLLRDSQTRFEGPGEEIYVRRAIKILKPEGLRAATSPSRVWQPESQTLTFNTLQITRNGQVIDLLTAKDLTVLRREKNLEAAILDGTLTATKQIEGLQVGDILEMSTTIQSIDPVRKGKSDGASGVAEPSPVTRERLRILWPKSEPMTWDKNAGLPEPVLREVDGFNELLFDMPSSKTIVMPNDVPPRFWRYQRMHITEFRDWQEISAMFAPLFAQASVISPGSALAAEAAKIKSATRDPKKRTEMALALVQDQVRYFLLAMGDGGYVPATAEETWNRRFGDCKGKTTLLLALLNELGVKAEAALVMTSGADGLNERLPRLGEFNHVLVRAHIGGKDYWIDGTRRAERAGLDDLPKFPFLWALPLKAGGAPLEEVAQQPRSIPLQEAHTLIDLSAGSDEPVKIVRTQTFRGDVVRAMAAALTGNDKDAQLQRVRQNMSSGFTHITFDVTWAEVGEDLVITATGVGPLTWQEDPETGVREYRYPGANNPLKGFAPRSPGPLADAPYVVNFPTAAAQTVAFVLPAEAEGVKAFGPKVDETVGGQEAACTESREGAKVTFNCKTRSVVKEIPATEAKAAETRISAILRQTVLLRRPATTPAPAS